MSHGLDVVETASTAASEPVAVGLFGRLFQGLNRLIVIVSSIALVVASGVLTYSVITRYFLHLSTDWQDELSVFLIVGAVFMSSAAIQANRGHVAIEAIVGLLPDGANRVRQRLVDLSLVSCSARSSLGNPGPCSRKRGSRTIIRAPLGGRRSGSPIRS